MLCLIKIRKFDILQKKIHQKFGLSGLLILWHHVIDVPINREHCLEKNLRKECKKCQSRRLLVTWRSRSDVKWRTQVSVGEGPSSVSCCINKSIDDITILHMCGIPWQRIKGPAWQKDNRKQFLTDNWKPAKETRKRSYSHLSTDITQWYNYVFRKGRTTR